MRLFIAAPIPASGIFTTVTRDLEKTATSVRPVPPGTWHVTLRFLGEIDDAEKVASVLQEALAGVAAAPAVVRGVGAFADPRNARVAWAAVDAPGLTPLEARIRKVTANMGSPPDPRAFVPHVTLARLQGPHDLRPWIRRHANTLFFDGNLGEVVLFRSERTHQGPLYTRHSVVVLGENL